MSKNVSNHLTFFCCLDNWTETILSRLGKAETEELPEVFGPPRQSYKALNKKCPVSKKVEGQD